MGLQRQGEPIGRRPLAVRACLLIAALAGTVCLGAGEVGDRPAREFIDGALRGIGAEKNECPRHVMEQVRARRMKAVCARFEGGFERFRVRWGLQMIQNGAAEDRGSTAGQSAVEPQTEWESNGATHDRIYRVGDRAVGVRFVAGDVLMVW